MRSTTNAISGVDDETGETSTTSQVTKARMLVSLLGADFAKTSSHPFFKELAHTAVKPVGEKPAPPDMSQSLAKLVRRLAEVNKAKSRTRPPAQAGPSSDREREQRSTPEIMAQHPALIAKHLVALPTDQQLEALRKLRGQTARQVTAYVAELKK